MERRGEMRAADADRQLVAERLRLAVDEGRLDLYEYDDRLRAAYAAKTYAELDHLLDDLPEPVPAQQAEVARQGGAVAHDPSVPAPDGRYPGATRQWLVENWAPYFSVVTISVAGWAIISMMAWEVLYFWPIWVAGPWGAVLLASTVSGLAQGKPQRVAAQRARKKAAKKARREQRAEGSDQEPGRASLPPLGEREGWQLGGKAD
ncbi:DUF1707 SHOCT-like domain-containing protein [Micromonospora sp. NBC_01796]|uniref:DUF1707 SHOCT-like domain-containing protein n=1 Tax=Micromonospora sp. NBC_01796 TaxID=2975987 RepID=UPI002DD94BBF|nr:DUF1707 domain-containing protein [Micromonospora sp. NBC_01796]WSA87759.1 DUF1707 domain-containing protein [Micromonospora sp. NBC_01796]